jgi:hypothetical protein
MLDVVVGDMAWAGNASTVDYSTFNPFNDKKYFHDYKLLSEDPLNTTCVLDVSLLSHFCESVAKVFSAGWETTLYRFQICEMRMRKSSRFWAPGFRSWFRITQVSLHIPFFFTTDLMTIILRS